ncbi:hypothetical protein Taro_051140 [Colocasia esculenta]|uniref:Uncharacterized protein n=1 Tax=Colocasia esculenta TaxID=4460 RepID=A0A843XFV8_COLES|nr:hypothetical protein [Colocasia esculenta]
MLIVVPLLRGSSVTSIGPALKNLAFSLYVTVLNVATGRYGAIPTAVRFLSRLAEQSFHKLCSTREGAVAALLSDLVLRRDIQLALNAGTLRGVGETPHHAWIA